MKVEAQNVKPGQTIHVLSGRKVMVNDVNYLESHTGHSVYFTLNDGKAFKVPFKAPIRIAQLG